MPTPNENTFDTAISEIKSLIAEKTAGTISESDFNTKTAEITKSINDRMDAIEAKLNRPEASGEGTDVSDAQYKAAFQNYLQTGQVSPELKAMSDTNAAGGYMVDRELYAGLISNIVENSPIRRYARVYTSDQPYLEIPTTVTSFSVSGVSSTGSRDATGTPTIVMKTLKSHEAYANCPATQTLLADVPVLQEVISVALTDQFANWEGNQFLNGDGTTEPEGILTNSDIVAAAVTTSASGQLVYKDLTKFVYSLKEAYRKNAVIMMNRTTIQALAELVDGNGRPIFVESVAAGTPPTLFGYPIVEANDIPEIASGAVVAVIGDFKAGYWILDRPGISMLQDPFTNKPFIQFYSTKRTGGIVVKAEAFKVLKMK